MSFGNPSAANQRPLVDHDPRKHGFRPYSLRASVCRVPVKVGSGYTLCYRSLAAHSLVLPAELRLEPR